MLKNILKLEGAQAMNTQEQKTTQGGILRYCCEWDYVNGKKTCLIWVSTGTYCP